MKKKNKGANRSAIDMVEEAVHLLRTAPLSVHGSYAVGTLPCVLGFLYFWADMSRGAFAREHAGRAAFGMALLYLWMKCWHSVYAAKLRALRFGQPDEPWTFRRAGRLVLQQSAVQPSGLFLTPLAGVVIIPAGWLVAFYQNASALGSDANGLRRLCGAAARQASVRKGQGALMLGLISIFAAFVGLNTVITMAMLPYMLKMFFGVETAFTQAGAASVLNTTYLACAFALTYTFVAPLLSAAYTLRCFYGQSLQTGEDLKSDLKRVRSALAAAAAIVILCAGGTVQAAPDKQPAAAPAVSASQLNRSIDKVLQRPEFAWRMPRQAAKNDDSGRQTWFGRMIGAIVDTTGDIVKYCIKSIGESIDWIMDRLRDLWPSSSHAETSALGWGEGFVSFMRILLVILIIAIAAVVAVLVMRLWRLRRMPNVVAATPMAARPDLDDENVAADQLPEEGWLKMARELMAGGNLRLALRAFYLAGLASLAARELISIATFKSNREYETELDRRGRAVPMVQTAFSQNVAAFDRAWYGLHEVTAEILHEFQANLERIRTP